jgi:hypothetical protein
MSDARHRPARTRDDGVGAITLPAPPTVGARAMALAGYRNTGMSIGFNTWPTSFTHTH